MKEKILLALFVILACFNAHSWDFNDFKEESLSPVITSPGREVILGGTVLTLAALGLKHPTVRTFEKSTRERSPLKGWAELGDYAGQLAPNIAYGLYQEYLGRNGDSLGHDRAIGMFKATAYSSAVVTVLKYSVREPRPHNGSIKNSWPSGHSATAFAFSGYVAAEHGWGWGSLATGLAAFCGYSRIIDHRHRLHDVTAGAAIGMAYGFGISVLGNNKNKKSSGLEAYVAPIYESGAKGLSLYAEF